MELRDLSDEALREHLRTRIADRRWTASEMIEVERRGLAVLHPDRELAAAFRERYERLLAPAREACMAAFTPCTETEVAPTSTR